MASKSAFPKIKEIKTFIIEGVGSGGDYHNVSTASFLLPNLDSLEKF
jgi:L-rhamnonate dehydratase